MRDQLGAYWLRLEQGGSRLAIIDGVTGQSLSYRALADASDAVAEAHYRTSKKALVFLAAHTDLVGITHFLGALRAGHAVHLLNPALSAERQAQLAAIYRPAFRTNTTENGYQTLACPAPCASVHPDLALLLSTSGSTGSAKLVRLSATNLTVNAQQIVKALSIDENARAYLNLPLSYTYGLSVLASHLAQHASVLAHSGSFLDARTWELVRRHDCNFLHGVPKSYELLRLVCEKGLQLPQITACAQSGGRLAPDLARWLMRGLNDRIRVYKMYGITEATARVAVLPADLLADNLESVGLAVSGSQFELGPEDELIYRGPNVMMGYATDAAGLARGDDLGGVLHTGDIGHMNENGLIYLRGRRDRICKVDGVRINLDELESRFFSDVPIAALYIGNAIRLCHENASNTVRARLTALARTLSISPAHLDCRDVGELPRLPNGKLDMAALQRIA